MLFVVLHSACCHLNYCKHINYCKKDLWWILPSNIVWITKVWNAQTLSLLSCKDWPTKYTIFFIAVINKNIPHCYMSTASSNLHAYSNYEMKLWKEINLFVDRLGLSAADVIFRSFSTIFWQWKLYYMQDVLIFFFTPEPILEGCMPLMVVLYVKTGQKEIEMLFLSTWQ